MKSSKELWDELQQLKEQVHRLEKNFSHRSVVYIDIEDTVDGSCSTSCAEYFVEMITIPGAISLISSKSKLIKGLWMITFVVGLILTVQYINRMVEIYIHDSTATKAKLIPQDNYSYPTMLFCPDTWLDYEKILNSGATTGAIQYALGYLIDHRMHPPPYVIGDYERAKTEFHQWYARNNLSLPELFKSIALDSDEFVYKCPECQSFSFSKVIMDESVCYKILPVKAAVGPGTARGTVDILEVKIPDKSHGLLSRKSYWRFYINPDLTVGVSSIQFDQVYPGYSNTIRLLPFKFNELNSSGDPCRTMDNSNRAYSRLECLLSCYNLRRRCVYMGDMRQTSVPRNLTGFCHSYPRDYWLRLNPLEERRQKLGHDIPESCYLECPTQCERWTYETFVESHLIYDHLHLVSDDFTNSSRLLTRFYFANLAPIQNGIVHFQEVSTFSLEQLIGNIGGALCLWLGVSAVSILHPIVFLFNWTFARYWNKSRKVKRTESTRGIVCDESAV